MERQTHLNAMDVTPPGWRTRASGAILVLGLLTAQGWLTLGLFGVDQPWQHLCDDQPIVSGRHPLHLYHGHLGARSFFEHGTLCCYDPAFQAGYPKTPVFDGGSRPAELFLGLVGGGYHPAAYKIGLAVCLCAVPLLLVLASRSAGLGRIPAFLAGVVGILVCWSDPCRDLIQAGEIDLLLSGLAALLLVAMLVRIDRAPGPIAWLGLLIAACLGWFAQPLVFLVLLVPMLLVFYATVGVRHGLAWHTCVLTALLGALAANVFWLIDWVAYWWVLTPPIGCSLLEQRTLEALWTTPFWGGPVDRAVAVALLLLAFVGLVLFNQQKGRLSARLLGLGCCGLLGLVVVGLGWEPLGRLGTGRLLVPALWFAALPAVYACQEGGRLLGRLVGPWKATALIAASLLGAGWALRTSLPIVVEHCRTVEPLEIGLGAERQAIVDALAADTNRDARILWEDSSTANTTAHWTTLLPLLTDRTYLGGLDPDAMVEFTRSGPTGQRAAGRPLARWTDADLDDFCQRYNLGWVMCSSPASVERFRSWSRATPVIALPDAAQTRWLFAIQRTPSFVLKGEARWIQADRQRIALADVVPDGDQVILSLHYHAGMIARPSHVHLEPFPDPRALDPIPFVRLRIPGPVTRLTLTWNTP
ncbi:MAG: hypothetical protein K2R98_25715 [Gemmataceae bacterium]|nr:hypothetical protein [Gemmataceae bacterium]